MHTRTDIGRTGNQLVLKSGTVLPARCIKTNEPISESDRVTEKFSWCSPLVGIMILLSGPLFLITYFAVRKKCTLTYGLRSDLLSRRRNRRRTLIIAAVVSFAAVVFAGSMVDRAVAVGILVFFLGAVVTLLIGNSPLSVTDHRDGQFSLKGFSSEFLNSIVPE